MCFRRWHEAWQRISGFWQEFECGYGRPTVSVLSVYCQPISPRCVIRGSTEPLRLELHPSFFGA